MKKQTKMVFKPKKLARNILYLVSFIGIIYVVGSVGACDSDNIGVCQALIQCMFGMTMSFLSGSFASLLNEEV